MFLRLIFFNAAGDIVAEFGRVFGVIEDIWTQSDADLNIRRIFELRELDIGGREGDCIISL